MRILPSSPRSATTNPYLDAARRGVLGYVPEILERVFYLDRIDIRLTPGFLALVARRDVLERIAMTTANKVEPSIVTTPEHVQQQYPFLRHYPHRLVIYGPTADTVKLLIGILQQLPVPSDGEPGFRLCYVEVAVSLVTRTQADAVVLGWYQRARINQRHARHHARIFRNTFYTGPARCGVRIAEYHDGRARKIVGEPNSKVEVRFRGARALERAGIDLPRLLTLDLASVIRKYVTLSEVNWPLVGLQCSRKPKWKPEQERRDCPNFKRNLRRAGHLAMRGWGKPSMEPVRLADGTWVRKKYWPEPILPVGNWNAQQVAVGLRQYSRWFRAKSALKPIDNTKLYGESGGVRGWLS